MLSSTVPSEPTLLRDVTASAGFAVEAFQVIQSVASCTDEASALEVLHCAKQIFGADQALFVSFVRDDDSKQSFRFLLDCDPAWCMEYQKQGWYAQDAWLQYAANNSSPACGTSIPARTKAQRQALELAATFGVASSYVVPAPAGGGLSRLGALILGSGRAGYFENDADGSAIAPLRIAARSFATELHEWWAQRVRKEIIATNRVGPEDLQLLEYERRGLTTKEIAELTGTSASAVDCRFQRLITKFNTPNRRATARLAAEYGLI